MRDCDIADNPDVDFVRRLLLLFFLGVMAAVKSD
jgi:hypothetical protein